MQEKEQGTAHHGSAREGTTGQKMVQQDSTASHSLPRQRKRRHAGRNTTRQHSKAQLTMTVQEKARQGRKWCDKAA
ncbi:hypothetical protein E2C01_093887 [Portunus trituberculatus]|uniref:Uncharacterized protein n=1 Tax=Portunus trituberculatus TaxID=210409 RepID=A0A5B7K1M1_PORTR|nr:hypothetical protein [Portunus trituberculatus]